MNLIPPSVSEPAITFQGNNYDLTAVVGVTIGVMTLLSWVTCNLAYYCLPVLPVILGVIGLASAKDSVDPERTRRLSWISIGSGAIILFLIILFVVVYAGLIVFFVVTEGDSSF